MIILIATILLTISILLILVILTGVFFTIDTFFDLPYVATKKDKVKTIIKLAKIKKGDRVIDLGSGDGRLLLEAAKKGADAIGYELNPFLVYITILKSLILSMRAKRSNLKLGSIAVLRKDLWKADLQKANVIFVYGRKKNMKDFERFTLKFAKKGTRVTVNTNPFPNKKFVKKENSVYLYRT